MSVSLFFRGFHSHSKAARKNKCYYQYICFYFFSACMNVQQIGFQVAATFSSLYLFPSLFSVDPLHFTPSEKTTKPQMRQKQNAIRTWNSVAPTATATTGMPGCKGKILTFVVKRKKNSRRQKSAFAFPLFFFSAANGCSPICCRKWKFKFLTNAEQAGQKVFQLHFFTAAVTAAGKFHTFPTAHFRNLFFVSIFFVFFFVFCQRTKEAVKLFGRVMNEWRRPLAVAFI